MNNIYCSIIASAVENGYTDPKGKDSSGAAQFASVLMSAKYPDRYVDFRGNRWNQLFKLISGSNKLLCTGSSYALKITKAGKFAAVLSATSIFKKHFGSGQGLWKAAGLAWNFKDGLFTINGVGPKRYWAGGFLWGGKTDKGVSHLEEFVSGNVWKLGFKRDVTDKKHAEYWALFDQIKPGDEFAIKGYGGKNDLKVHYIGEVQATDNKKGVVNLRRIDRPLFHGKAPSPGFGNWFGTLLEVTDSDAVQEIFHGAPTPTPIRPFPLNLILYGPPGTGKTYALRNQYMAQFTDRQIRTREHFARELAEGLTWLQTIIIVLYDLSPTKVPTIFDHPLLQVKSRMSANQTPKNTIWGWLQRHTKDDCPNVKYSERHDPQLFWKDEKSVWSVDREMVAELFPELIDKFKIFKEFTPETGEIKRYEFVTFHQSYSYEDFVEGIKPVMSEDVSESLIYEIKPGIFRNIVKKALDDPEHNYALLIDEINRGNIANIFGELIALIEDDKRKGALNELKVQLPHSREEFSVPKNLYIIGAMNTADRSVEALDTALRRRFTFIPVQPEPQRIQQPAEFAVDLRQLLVTMNARIEKLLDKDHCIGHSYFMGLEEATDPLEELRRVFGTKILPLLEEYFYSDPAKIGMILGERFVSRKDENVKWATGDWGLDEFDEMRVYSVNDPETMTEEDFRTIYE